MIKQWHASQPIYLQLQQLIESQIIEGKITEGSMLPSIRQLSMDYQLNPLTVSKVYQLLVGKGLVETQRGVGMLVLAGAQHKLQHEQKKNFLKQEWPLLKSKLKRLGITIEELLRE